MAKKRIYLDTAAGTLTGKLGNPASLHREGVAAARVLAQARTEIAEALDAHPDEIIFTSGGTESNHLALEVAQEGEIIVSTIEHPSILNAAPQAIKVPVGKDGIIDLKKLKAGLTPKTKLVSVIYVNNEIGTIQPIREIAKIIRAHRKNHQTKYPYFHTDACQAARFLDLSVARLGVDLLTLNAAKFYGPRGVGVLYARRGIKLEREGTPNVPGIAGLAAALKLAQKNKKSEAKKLSNLRNYFITELEKIAGVEINGVSAERAPHIISAIFPTVLGEQMVIELDARGIAVSTGSACAIATADESYVILALGKSKKSAEHSVRFSLDRSTTKADLVYVVKMIKEVIHKYEKFK